MLYYSSKRVAEEQRVVQDRYTKEVRKMQI